MDQTRELRTELQALHNANLGLDPLLHCIETGDRIGGVERLMQLMDALVAGRELDDSERGYVLIPFGQLTVQQARQFVPAPWIAAFRAHGTHTFLLDGD